VIITHEVTVEKNGRTIQETYFYSKGYSDFYASADPNAPVLESHVYDIVELANWFDTNHSVGTRVQTLPILFPRGLYVNGDENFRFTLTEMKLDAVGLPGYIDYSDQNLEIKEEGDPDLICDSIYDVVIFPTNGSVAPTMAPALLSGATQIERRIERHHLPNREDFLEASRNLQDFVAKNPIISGYLKGKYKFTGADNLSEADVNWVSSETKIPRALVRKAGNFLLELQ